MQSYYSNKTQPYPLADYPIFVAEVASTFNEALLIDYMLANIKDDDTRLSLLGNYLENIKGTVFRQTQFAEFELGMHEMAQKGQPITGDSLSKLYMDITKRYYGHDQGVTVVDDYVANEWSYIPHFYYDFYVYQYATSFTASAALAEKVRNGDAEAKRRYLAFLSAGGSKYPIDLLKDAGVDMTTDEPLESDDEGDDSGDGRDGKSAGETRPLNRSAQRIFHHASRPRGWCHDALFPRQIRLRTESSMHMVPRKLVAPVWAAVGTAVVLLTSGLVPSPAGS